MNNKEILQEAFNEGKKHIGKDNATIYYLAEEYVQSQDYDSIEQDDAIYVAFIEGATSK